MVVNSPLTVALVTPGMFSKAWVEMVVTQRMILMLRLFRPPWRDRAKRLDLGRRALANDAALVDNHNALRQIESASSR
jgi:hypothetical protein